MQPKDFDYPYKNTSGSDINIITQRVKDINNHLDFLFLLSTSNR
ncbi:hypothetical protein CAAU_1005 [Caloramator australicus RC3]|uniref:Uncharacterized protein n=1 Tax=Caloramator australicus RC3 TaxID=857293 RepID=I7K6A2_9CLOT|nr:hypothetical protein CAAU_1005 [Caloramator australicus RC3]